MSQPRRLSGIYAGAAAACGIESKEYTEAFAQTLDREIIFDTQSIARGSLDATAITNSIAASENHVTDDDKVIRVDADTGDLVIPFFVNGLADSTDTVQRSLRDTNVWGGKYGSLHHVDHPFGVRTSKDRGMGRSRAMLTHLAIDIFNQDGSVALDTDLIDIQHAYLLLRGEVQGLAHPASPLEIGSAAQFHGLWRMPSGGADTDAGLTALGSASNSWRDGRAAIRTKRPLLLDLADLSNDNRPTRTWIEMRVPFANKAGGTPTALNVADGFARVDDGAGAHAPAATQVPLQIRLSALAALV